MENILHFRDEGRQNRTFLHIAASQALADTVRQIVLILGKLPKELAAVLSEVRDKENHTSLDLACSSDKDSDEKMDCIYQLGSFPVDFHYLKKLHPPTVLLYYRLPKAPGLDEAEGREKNKERDEAEEEVEALHQYFAKRNFTISRINDFTEDDLTKKMMDHKVESGLIVFILSSGADGIIDADGAPNYITAKNVILQMCAVAKGKPKVRFTHLHVLAQSISNANQLASIIIRMHHVAKE